MIQVTQSPFLQALGYAIINSLWQFALLWLIYLLVNSVFKLSASRRYATALMLQLLGFAWFVGTVVYYYQYCVQLASDVSALKEYGYYLSPASAITFKEKAYAVLMQAELLLPYLSLAYMLLLVFLSLKVCKSYQQMIMIRKVGLKKIDVNWRLFVQQLAYQLGIKQNVRVYISNFVQSPVTIGFFKPLILLPVSAIANLSTEQVEAILLHELAHIKRHDYLINLLVSIIEVALFFNPFMQLISRHIKRERENSCDDWVLQYQYNAATYAKALLKIAITKNNLTNQFAIGAVDSKRALLIRVKRMIEKNDRTFNYRQQLIALLFMTSIFITVAWFAPAKNHSKHSNEAVAKKINPVTQPLLAKTDNPLFNPVFFLVKSKKEKPREQVSKSVIEEKEEPAIIENVEPVEENADENLQQEKARQQIEQQAKETRFSHPASLVGINEAAYKTIHIDTAQLYKEMRKIYTSHVFTEAQWRLMQKQLVEIKNVVLSKNQHAISLFDSEKAQMEIQNALDHLKELKLRYSTRGRQLVLAAKQKDNNDDEDNEENKLVYKNMEIQAFAEKVRSQIEAIKALEMLAKKSEENFSFSFETPAVFKTVEKPSTFSYEYRDIPRTQITISSASKCSCPAAAARASRDVTPRVEVNTNENIEEVEKPVERKRIFVKTKAIVHI